jgi:hypothetical protein
MAGNVLHIALSESFSLVWAIEASASETYCCVRCGAEVRLDTFENEFRHPPSTVCSAWHSTRRCAVLLLQNMFDEGRSAIVLAQICSFCGQTHERTLPADSSSYLLSIEEINDAVLIDSEFRLLVAMRPIPAPLPKLAQQLGACWVEVDPRNVLSGTPILALSGDLEQHTCSLAAAPKFAEEKISNPYSRISSNVQQGGEFAE